MTRRDIQLTLAALVVPCLLAGDAGSQAAGGTKVPPYRAPYGIGRTATPGEIRALDIDVRPDGRGLPPGRGSVAEGRAVYAAKCASCHGREGEGGSADRLVGRDAGANFAFATDPTLVKTVGNYWPYATTLFDYTQRAMPFLQPGTLTPDETYGLVAYILSLNKIVGDDAVMDQATLPKVVMPARDRFVVDDRKGGKPVK
jgi:S-disulfanyl-L-cysteine oxidoreductase SoxD